MPRSRRHYRITLGDILSAHEVALSYGGMPGIHSLALIQSAIARPYSGYYRRMAQKSAALVQSVATNHGFLDGNKRTTLILVKTLLDKSGYVLFANGNVDRPLENIILGIVGRQLGFDDLVQWFEARLRKKA